MTKYIFPFDLPYIGSGSSIEDGLSSVLSKPDRVDLTSHDNQVFRKTSGRKYKLQTISSTSTRAIWTAGQGHFIEWIRASIDRP